MISPTLIPSVLLLSVLIPMPSGPFRSLHLWQAQNVTPAFHMASTNLCFKSQLKCHLSKGTLDSY